MNRVRKSYDEIASEYACRIYDELMSKPLDRELLDRFAASTRGSGLVGDVGCGPGHVARYLHDRGVRVFGVDVSSEMVVHARRLNRDLEFQQGDMRRLDVPDSSWAGATVFYSIIHFAPIELATVFRELRRVLQPGGLLLLTVHVGEGAKHLDEWWARKVSLDSWFFDPADLASRLETAGFHVDEIVEREPYPDVEVQTRRAYIFARTAPDCGNPS